MPEPKKLKLAVYRVTECFGGGLYFVPIRFKKKFEKVKSEWYLCDLEFLGIFEFEEGFVKKLNKQDLHEGGWYYDETYIE